MQQKSEQSCLKVEISEYADRLSTGGYNGQLPDERCQAVQPIHYFRLRIYFQCSPTETLRTDHVVQREKLFYLTSSSEDWQNLERPEHIGKHSLARLDRFEKKYKQSKELNSKNANSSLPSHLTQDTTLERKPTDLKTFSVTLNNGVMNPCGFCDGYTCKTEKGRVVSELLVKFVPLSFLNDEEVSNDENAVEKHVKMIANDNVKQLRHSPPSLMNKGRSICDPFTGDPDYDQISLDQSPETSFMEADATTTSHDCKIRKRISSTKQTLSNELDTFSTERVNVDDAPLLSNKVSHEADELKDCHISPENRGHSFGSTPEIERRERSRSICCSAELIQLIDDEQTESVTRFSSVDSETDEAGNSLCRIRDKPNGECFVLCNRCLSESSIQRHTVAFDEIYEVLNSLDGPVRRRIKERDSIDAERVCFEFATNCPNTGSDIDQSRAYKTESTHLEHPEPVRYSNRLKPPGSVKPSMSGKHIEYLDAYLQIKSTLNRQLRTVQEQLASILFRLTSLTDSYHGVQIDADHGVTEQIRRFKVLHELLSEKTRVGIIILCHLARQYDILIVQNELSHLVTECEQMIQTVESRIDDLEHLNSHLQDIQVLGSEKLGWIEQVSAEVDNLRQQGLDVHHTKEGLEVRFSALCHIISKTCNREEKMAKTLQELKGVTTRNTKTCITTRYGIQGIVQNSTYYKELKRHIQTSWSNLKNSKILDLVKAMVTEIIHHGDYVRDKVLREADQAIADLVVGMTPEHFQNCITILNSALHELVTCQTSIADKVERLVNTSLDGTFPQLPYCTVIGKIWDDMSQMCNQLQRQKNEIEFKYVPLVSILREKMEFLDWVKVQLNALSPPSTTDIEQIVLNDFLPLSGLDHLELTKLGRNECQQLIETVLHQQQEFFADVSELLNVVPYEALSEEIIHGDVNIPQTALATEQLHATVLDCSIGKIKEQYQDLLCQLKQREMQYETFIATLHEQGTNRSFLRERGPKHFGALTDIFESDMSAAQDSEPISESHLEPGEFSEQHNTDPICRPGEESASQFDDLSMYTESGAKNSTQSSQSNLERLQPITQKYRPSNGPQIADSLSPYAEVSCELNEQQLHSLIDRYRNAIVDISSRPTELCQTEDDGTRNLSGRLKSALLKVQDIILEVQITAKQTQQASEEQSHECIEENNHVEEHNESMSTFQSKYRGQVQRGPWDFNSFVKELKGSESLLLAVGKLSEQVTGRCLLLDSWMTPMTLTLEGRIEEQMQDTQKIISTLSECEAIKRKLIVHVAPLTCLEFETELLCDRLSELSRCSSFLSSTINTGNPIIEIDQPPAVENSSADISALSKKTVTVFKDLTELRLKLKKKMGTQLIRGGQADVVLKELQTSVTNDYDECIGSCDALQKFTEDNLELDQIQTAKLQRMFRLKHSEIQQAELRTNLSILAIAEHGISPTWNSYLCDLHREFETQLVASRDKQIKLEGELEEIKRLDTVLNEQAAWMRRYVDTFETQSKPEGLSVAAVSLAASKFEADLERFREKCRSRLLSHLQWSSENTSKKFSLHELVEIVHAYMNKHFEYTSSELRKVETTGGSSPTVSRSPGFWKLIQQQTRSDQMFETIGMEWKTHLAHVTAYEEQKNRIHFKLEAAQISLSKLYRPSKLVDRCSKQINEIAAVKHQLKTCQEDIDQLSMLPSQLRSFIQPLESVQMMATVRRLKHNHQCLVSRSSERQKILTQAFKEDQTFDCAYKRLLCLLKDSYSDASERPPIQPDLIPSNKHLFDPTLESENFWTVLRMGSYLQNRCTQIDEERSVIGGMLEDLRQAWQRCTEKYAERLLSSEKISLRHGELEAANQKLTKWLQSAEDLLSISCSPTVTKTVATEFDITGMISAFGVEELPDSPLICLVCSDVLFKFGLSKKDCQSLFRVYGCRDLAAALHEEHQRLLRELGNRLQLWNSSANNAVDDDDRGIPAGLPIALSSRIQRLQVACHLRQIAIQNSTKTADYIDEAVLKLSKWLDGAAVLLSSFGTVRFSSSTGKRDDSPFSQMLQPIVLPTEATEYQISTWLAVYEIISVTQSELKSNELKALQIVFRLLFGQGISRETSHVIWGRFHRKSRGTLEIQYENQLLQFNEVDKAIRSLRGQLESRGCLPVELCQMEHVESRMRELSKSLDHELAASRYLQRELAGILISLKPPIEILPDVQLLNQNLGTVEEEFDRLLQNIQDSSDWNADPVLNQLESSLNRCRVLIENATVIQKQISDFWTGIENRVTQYAKHFSVPEEMLLSTSASSWSPEFQKDISQMTDLTSLVSDQFSPEHVNSNAMSHLSGSPESNRQTNLQNEQNLKSTFLIDKARISRCRLVPFRYHQLRCTAARHLSQVQRLMSALEERIQSSTFDFDQWRKNFIQWQTKRRLRLRDFFTTTDPFDELHKPNIQRPQRQTTWNAGQQQSERNDYALIKHSGSLSRPSASPGSTIAFGSGRMRVKNAQSLEHLGFVDQKDTMSQKELTCTSFVTTIQRTLPDFQGSGRIQLHAAFRTMDKERRGKITYSRFLECLLPDRTNQNLSDSELIANAIRAEAAKCCCQQRFLPIKVDENKYRFGSSNRVYLVRFLNSMTMVRVGGGWLNLVEFLATRDPCRVRGKSATIDVSTVTATVTRSTPDSKLGSLKVSNDKHAQVTPTNRQRFISAEQKAKSTPHSHHKSVLPVVSSEKQKSSSEIDNTKLRR